MRYHGTYFRDGIHFDLKNLVHGLRCLARDAGVGVFLSFSVLSVGVLVYAAPGCPTPEQKAATNASMASALLMVLTSLAWAAAGLVGVPDADVVPRAAFAF